MSAIMTILQSYGTMELLCTMEKLWYYGRNYGTMEKIMVVYPELWNFDLRNKKHYRLPQTKKLSFIVEKPKLIYHNNCCL